MADELETLASKVRERLERGEGGSLASILCDLGISPENYEQIRGLLKGLGYSDSQLLDTGQMIRIAEGFLSSMPLETRRQITGMMLQVVADMNGGTLPPEVAGFVSALGDGNGTCAREAKG